MKENTFKTYIDSILNQIETLLLNNMSSLNISRDEIYDLEELPSRINDIIRISFLHKLMETDLKALDAFEKEFIIGDLDKSEYIYNNDDAIKKLVELKLNNPNIPVENILLTTDRRFAVLYEDKPIIVNVPIDIFRFLVRNEYDESVINYFENPASVHYNVTKIFKDTLKLGKNFKRKSQLLGKNARETNVIDYLINKYNTDHPNKIVDLYRDEFGEQYYDYTIKKCKKLNINYIEVMNRVLHSDINYLNKAIEIGVDEKNKYGITYNFKDTSYNRDTMINVFSAIIREYIQNQNNKDIMQ